MAGPQKIRPSYITGVHYNENRGYSSDPAPQDNDLHPGFGESGDEPPTSDDGERKLAAKAHNEGVKLYAAGMNALAVAVLTTAVILPLIKDVAVFVVEYRPVWYFVGIGLHIMGQIALRSQLRSED